VRSFATPGVRRKPQRPSASSRNAIAAGLSLLALPASGVAAGAATLARGEYLAAAAGCISCHTDRENDGPDYAGGHELETPYGVFIAPNITPDTNTGIGGWTEAQFIAALRDGVAPDGSRYYPAFPYPSYAGMREEDAAAIYAYLQSIPPADRMNEPHRLAWYVPGNWAMRIWNALFTPWEYPGTSTEFERGAYLVRHLGHCGECHTPRNLFGALDTGRELAGSPKDSTGRGAPAIDTSEAGLAAWSVSDVEFFLEIGMMPDGDFAGGGMADVIDDNTSRLTPEDRRAMAEFLLRAARP